MTRVGPAVAMTEETLGAVASVGDAAVADNDAECDLLNLQVQGDA